eukprot:772919-Rhodomonas_salina.1
MLEGALRGVEANNGEGDHVFTAQPMLGRVSIAAHVRLRLCCSPCPAASLQSRSKACGYTPCQAACVQPRSETAMYDHEGPESAMSVSDTA